MLDDPLLLRKFSLGLRVPKAKILSVSIYISTGPRFSDIPAPKLE